MAGGEIELKTQEIVFVGHLYLNPSEILRYGQFLDTNRILTTEPAKTLWRKLRAYYDKYNDVPAWDTLGNLWGEKEQENLTLGVQLAEDDEVKAQFILDTFADTMQLLTYKKAVADMEKVLETGANSLNRDIKISKLMEIERTLGTQLNIVRQAGVNPGGTNIETFNAWAEGKLPFQQPTIPVPIPGLEWIQGTPVGTVNVLIGGYGTGKEQPKSLVVPTPLGNRLWGSLRCGDYVFGIDGKPTKILQTFDNGLKDIYKVTFDDGSSTLCGAEHLWTVRGRNARRHDRRMDNDAITWQTLTTEEIIKLGVKLPHGKCSPLRQWEIPSYAPVQYKPKHLPIHPYILGLWLGDGDGSGRLCLNSNHVSVRDYLRSISSFSMYYSKKSQNLVYVSIRGIRSGLRELGLYKLRSYEKYIPTMYLESTVEDRLELLRGLMDSDGECTKSRTCAYRSSSHSLCDGVVALVRSLGGKARSIKTKKAGYKSNGVYVRCRDSYSTTFVLPNGVIPFRSIQKRLDRYTESHQSRYLTRWIDSIEKLDTKEECMCIKVDNPSGLYLTNDFIVTHNTSSLCTMAAELSKTEDILYVTLETHSNAVVFKIAACQTDGKLPANYVFMNPATLTPEEAAVVDEAFAKDVQGRHTIYYLDMLPGQATAAQIEGYLRNLMRQYSTTISTVFVDYAGLMRTNSGSGREDVGWGYTGTIITELSAVAKALNLTIWTAAQAGGDASHTVTDNIGTDFKPLRGGKLYGSKEVLFDASMALGISMMRSTQHSHLAVGVISTVKNRYGKEFYDYICEMDYSKSKLKVLGALRGVSEADTIETVRTHLKSIERDYEISYHMKHKQDVQDELSKHTFKTEFKMQSAPKAAKQQPKPARNPSEPANQNSMNSAY